MATGALTVRPKPPEVTMPITAPSAASDLRALAHRRAAGRADADALARGPVGEFAQDALGAGEAALRAPPLRDGEGQVGLDRRRRLVEVVAVERQPGFQPQRIARAEADRLHLRLGEQRARHALRVAWRERRSRSRPRRYSRSARRGSRCRRTRRWSPLMKTSVGGLRAVPRQHRRRLRSLQREQRAIVRAAAASRRPAGARAT